MYLTELELLRLPAQASMLARVTLPRLAKLIIRWDPALPRHRVRKFMSNHRSQLCSLRIIVDTQYNHVNNYNDDDGYDDNDSASRDYLKLVELSLDNVSEDHGRQLLQEFDFPLMTNLRLNNNCHQSCDLMLVYWRCLMCHTLSNALILQR